MSAFRRPPPPWFWIAAVVLLIWAAMGCYACVQQFRLGAEAMGPASAYDRALYARLPGWYDWVYAIAVGAGLAGALALLARSRLARAAFAVSLVAVLVQFGWLFATTDIVAAKGAATVVPFPVFIVAVALFQIWFANLANRRRWIG